MQVGYEGQFEGGKLATLVDADGYLAKTIIAGKRGQGTGRGGGGAVVQRQSGLG